MADRRKKTMVWVPRDLLGVLQQALHDNSPPGAPWTLQRTVEWALIRSAWRLFPDGPTAPTVPKEYAAVLADRLTAVGAKPGGEPATLFDPAKRTRTYLDHCEVCLTLKADHRSDEDRLQQPLFVCSRCGAEEG